MKPVQFGIVGAGAISAAHVRALKGLDGLAELVAIADIDKDRAKSVASDAGVSAFESLEEMLTGGEIDAVCVCTPPNVHAEVAVAAMRAGKHAIIEKPADATVAAAEKILEAAHQTGRKATVISQHRFDPSALIVRKAVEQGRLGRPTRAAAQVRWWRPQPYFDQVPWRGSIEVSGGGALISQAIHTLDLMLWTMGAVEEVFAYEATLAHERLEIEDQLTAVLKFRNGAIGIVEASIAAYPGMSARLELSGDRGSAVIDSDQLIYFHAANEGETTGIYGAFGDTNRAEAELAALTSSDIATYCQAPNLGDGPVATVVGREGAGAQAAASGAQEPGQLSSAHQSQLRDFAEAIQQDRAPAISLRDSLYVLQVAFALHQSAQQHRPIKLP